MYLLGYDIGSSSIKASLIEVNSGACKATDFLPKTEMPILSMEMGWAEQSPEMWWKYICEITPTLLHKAGITGEAVRAIGISYQMHGLVCVDKEQNPVRPAIIWCDSRAVQLGEGAFNALGSDYALNHLLNSPGNFTASKLAWVKRNEPELFERIDKIMLPGDYVAMKLTGETTTTLSGLSEGIFWDFKKNSLSEELLTFYGFNHQLIPRIVPTFGEQGVVSRKSAELLGLKAGTPVTYRAGDQPNNALSLNVFEPGEIASTAGTSGVVYGVNDTLKCDPLSRVNSFAHVNHNAEQPRIGVLLCINGTGILNSWVKSQIANNQLSYNEMNEKASTIPVGAEGVSILPFGNGAERILQNREVKSSIHGLYFNRHTTAHIIRAAQEGIAFSFNYGMQIMQEMGIETKVIKAGETNMFLSPIFRETLAAITGATIELYNTDGSMGAAKGAGLGAKLYANRHEAFASMQKTKIIEPNKEVIAATREAYERWARFLCFETK